MSVTMSRFVNGMTGGRVNKDWDLKSMSEKDQKFDGILQALDTELARVTALGATVDPAWVALRGKLLTDVVTTRGQRGAKLLDHLDGVHKRARKAVIDAKAYLVDVTKKIDERTTLLNELKVQIKTAEDDVSITSAAQLKRQNSAILDGLKDSLEFCAKGTDYAQAQHDFVMSELKDIKKNLAHLGKSAFHELPITDVAEIAKEMDDARENPNSDMGQMMASVGQMMTESRLYSIKKLKNKHGVDFRPLEAADLLAIYTYTTPDGDYQAMHQLLLGKRPEDKKIRAKIDFCLNAMKKLPDYPAAASPLFRLENGGKYPWQEQFVIGKTFTIKIFWSTGKNNGVDTEGMDPGPILNITVYGKSGKDVAKMSGAQGEGGGEVLFPPGTKFQTIDVDDPDGVTFKKFGLNKAGPDDKISTIYLTVQEV
jgi:hypothetical protein